MLLTCNNTACGGIREPNAVAFSSYYYTRPPFRCAARACADAVRPAALHCSLLCISELCLRPNPCGIECTDCTAQYTLPEMGGSIEPPEPPLATGLDFRRSMIDVSTFKDRYVALRRSCVALRRSMSRCVDLRGSMCRLSKIDVSTFGDGCVDLRRPMIDVSTFEDR